jgi:hypothetical protein
MVVGFYGDVVVGVVYGSWVLLGRRGRGCIWQLGSTGMSR